MVFGFIVGFGDALSPRVAANLIQTAGLFKDQIYPVQDGERGGVES